jgi:F-type H+-transporting ATPase subunit b
MQELLASTTFWYALSFTVFVVLAYRLGARAVVQQLDKQIQEIKKKIDTAESLRVEAQEMLAQYQRKQRDALKDAEQIIEDAKVSATKIRAQAEADLEASMARREQQVSERINRMQQSAVDEIQDHAADLAVRAARRMIREKLEKTSDGGLVEESVKNISSQLQQ